MKRRLDDILDAIGPDAGDDDPPVDPRLERLAAGELSANELANLRAEGEHDPDLAAAIELYAPLGAEFAARTSQRVTAMVPPPAPTPAREERAAPKPIHIRVEEPPPSLFDRLFGWLRQPAFVGGLVAAFVALFMVMPGPTLPEMRVTVRSGDAPLRGNVPRGATHAPGSLVKLAVQADGEWTGALWATIVDDFEGRKPILTHVEAARAGSGWILQCKVGACVGTEPGTHRVKVALSGAAEALTLDDIERAAGGSVRVVEAEVEVTAP